MHRRSIAQCDNVFDETTALGIQWDPSFRMHFAERNLDRPLMIAKISKAIDGEIQTLSNAHACGTHEKQSVCFDSIPFAELVANADVILGRERPGKVLVLMREIPANKEVFSYAVYSFFRKIPKTFAQIVDLVNTGAGTEVGQGREPSEYMRIPPQLR
jgi:hypothetical protein